MIDQLIDDERRQMRRRDARWQVARLVGYALALVALVWLVGCGDAAEPVVKPGPRAPASERNAEAWGSGTEPHVCSDEDSDWLSYGYWVGGDDATWQTVCRPPYVNGLLERCKADACEAVTR